MASIEEFSEERKKELIAKFAIAAEELHQDMAIRIFDKNQDRNGSPQKPYSTDPISVKAPPDGIPREGGRKSKSGKTRYFEGGYSQLKSAMGQAPQNLFGALKTSFVTGLREINEYEYHISMREEEFVKTTGKLKVFFYPTKEEIEQAKKTILE